MAVPKKKLLFIPGAYLFSIPSELSEEQFIKKAGGMDKLREFKSYPFVSVVLDDPKEPFLVGHNNGRVIALTMSGHKQWQTMEWK